MAVKKKVAAKKAAAPKRAPAIAAKQTKTQVIQALVDSTGLSKKDVSAVFKDLGELVERHMRKRGSRRIHNSRNRCKNSQS